MARLKQLDSLIQVQLPCLGDLDDHLIPEILHFLCINLSFLFFLLKPLGKFLIYSLHLLFAVLLCLLPNLSLLLNQVLLSLLIVLFCFLTSRKLPVSLFAMVYVIEFFRYTPNLTQFHGL